MGTELWARLCLALRGPTLRWWQGRMAGGPDKARRKESGRCFWRVCEGGIGGLWERWAGGGRDGGQMWAVASLGEGWMPHA